MEDALQSARDAARAWTADNQVREECRRRVRTHERPPNEAHTMEARLLTERASSLGDYRELTQTLNESMGQLRDAILREAAEPSISQQQAKKGRK